MVITADDLELELQQEFAKKNKPAPRPASWVPYRCKLLLGTGVTCAVLILALPQLFQSKTFTRTDLAPLPGQSKLLDVAASDLKGQELSENAPAAEEVTSDAGRKADGEVEVEAEEDRKDKEVEADQEGEDEKDNDAEVDKEDKEESVVKDGKEENSDVDAKEDEEAPQDKADTQVETEEGQNAGGQAESTGKDVESEDVESGEACLIAHAYHRGTMVQDNAFASNGRECWAICVKNAACNFWDYGEGYCRLRGDAGSGAVKAVGYVAGIKNCKFASKAGTSTQARFISCPA